MKKRSLFLLIAAFCLCLTACADIVGDGGNTGNGEAKGKESGKAGTPQVQYGYVELNDISELTPYSGEDKPYIDPEAGTGHWELTQLIKPEPEDASGKTGEMSYTSSAL